MLAVFAGMPGSERLFQLCSLIVLISVVIHGASPMLLTRFSKKVETEEPPQPPEPPRESRTLPVIDVGAGGRQSKHHARRIGPTPEIRRRGHHRRLANRAKPRYERVAGRRIGAPGPGERSRPSSEIESSKGGVAHCLLRLTKRSDERPGGAGTSTSRMDQSPRADWRLGGLAKLKLTHRGDLKVIILNLCASVSLW